MISEIVDDSCSEAEKEQNSLLNIKHRKTGLFSNFGLKFPNSSSVYLDMCVYFVCERTRYLK
jgi:hypothetical protein